MDFSKLSVVFGGPQGSGKTTLANAWSERHGVEFSHVSTSSMMPEGVSTHLGVLRMAALEPAQGVEFQSNLIKARAELFQSRSDMCAPFTSDRAVIDSFAYYVLHNSMFAPEGTTETLRKYVEDSFDHVDVHVVVSPYNIKPEDNSVRTTGSEYYEMFAAGYCTLARMCFEAKFPNSELVSFEPTEDENSPYASILVGSGKVLIFLIEPNGFMGVENRMNLIEASLESLKALNLTSDVKVTRTLQ